eukprot:PhF_6_TR969/c0_g1_i1/m.1848
MQPISLSARVRSVEATDPKFHQKPFVKELYRKINQEFGTLLDTTFPVNGPEGGVGNGGTSSAQQYEKALQTIRTSPQFSVMCDALRKALLEPNAIEHLLQEQGHHGNLEDGEGGDTYGGGGGMGGGDGVLFSADWAAIEGADDDDDTYLLGDDGSTLHDRILGLARCLNPNTHNTQQRMEAMTKLSKLPATDVVCNEHWEEIFASIYGALGDPATSQDAFSLLLHIMQAAPPEVAAGLLVSVFRFVRQVPVPRSIIAAWCMIVELPSSWCFLEDSIAEELLTQWFDVLCSFTLPCFDVIDVMDPHAVWLELFVKHSVARRMLFRVGGESGFYDMCLRRCKTNLHAASCLAQSFAYGEVIQHVSPTMPLEVVEHILDVVLESPNRKRVLAALVPSLCVMASHRHLWSVEMQKKMLSAVGSAASLTSSSDVPIVNSSRELVTSMLYIFRHLLEHPEAHMFVLPAVGDFITKSIQSEHYFTPAVHALFHIQHPRCYEVVFGENVPVLVKAIAGKVAYTAPLRCRQIIAALGGPPCDDIPQPLPQSSSFRAHNQLLATLLRMCGLSYEAHDALTQYPYAFRAATVHCVALKLQGIVSPEADVFSRMAFSTLGADVILNCLGTTYKLKEKARSWPLSLPMTWEPMDHTVGDRTKEAALEKSMWDSSIDAFSFGCGSGVLCHDNEAAMRFRHLIDSVMEAVLQPSCDYDCMLYSLSYLVMVMSRLDLGILIEHTYHVCSVFLPTPQTGGDGVDTPPTDAIGLCRSHIVAVARTLGGPSERYLDPNVCRVILDGAAAQVDVTQLKGCSPRTLATPFPRIQLEGVVKAGIQFPNMLFPVVPFLRHVAEIVVSYGTRLGITSITEAALCQLLQVCAHMVTKCEGGGVDWFVVVTYLACQHRDEAWCALSGIASRSPPCVLWQHLSHHNPNRQEYLEAKKMVLSSIDSVTCVELPMVFNSLASAGLRPSDVAHLWITQCFLNVLNFGEIRSILEGVLRGGNCMLALYCVAIFKHYEGKILLWASQGKLRVAVMLNLFGFPEDSRDHVEPFTMERYNDLISRWRATYFWKAK